MADETTTTETTTETTTAQATLPGVQATTEDTAATKLKAEVKAAKDKVASMELADKQRKAHEASEKKKIAEAKAIADGEAQKVIEAKETELAEIRTRTEKLEATIKGRVEKNIAKLPDTVKKEIEMIKDSLPMHRLEELVDMKLEQAAQVTAPPAASVGGRRARETENELHAETHMVLDSLYVSPEVKAIGKKVGNFPIGGGDNKFRWEGTGNDAKDTQAFIHLLNQIAQDPRRDMSNQARKKVLG